MSLDAQHTEGLGFVVTEDSSGTAINQFTFTEGTSGLNGAGPVTINNSSAPIASGLIGSDLVFFASANTPNGLFTGAGASYSVAWGQYNSSATQTDGVAPHTYTVDFQIFNPDGTTGVESGTNPNGTTPSPVQLFSPVDVSSFAAAPAWFCADGTNLSGTVVYGGAYEAISGVNGASDPGAPSNSAFIQFQSFTVTGTPTGPAFQITPNLSAYAPGATDQIVQETDSGRPHGDRDGAEFHHQFRAE